MQGEVCPTLNPRPAEEDFYNALPETDPTLLPDDAQPEMEEEAEPAREAENLAAANVAPSVAQDEGTRQAEPSCSNQVPLPDFHDFRAWLERLEQGQLTLQQRQGLLLKNQETIMQQLAQLLNVGGNDLANSFL